MSEIIINFQYPNKRKYKTRPMNEARANALANGDRFYKGNSCKKNHDGLRWAVDAHCKTCKEEARKKERGLAKTRLLTKKHELKKFGLSLDDYKLMLIKQNYVCAICKKPEKIKNYKTQKINSLAVDHCHDTGKVRGLLCCACNQGIGLLNHDPELIRNARLYIVSNSPL